MVAALLLTRVDAQTSYVTGVLPAFLLAGVGFGLCGPSLQIGALSGVFRSDAGLVSGLVETAREIGGATGVAVVATALVAGTGVDGFRAAFALIAALAGLALPTTVLNVTKTGRISS